MTPKLGGTLSSFLPTDRAGVQSASASMPFRPISPRKAEFEIGKQHFRGAKAERT